ncbi:Flp family type IVb pilin [Ruegeria marina]|uniref:Flp pilus assembly protein, pilin Flp n=1 Tax=Ruegeria marina TaxID=639004 RepID=A0A1G6TNT7_9RHOB|nr:hypothetical protein [Ruegeria marina]SDD30730.1 hypothetical protein SAMN04488239_106145 [Ruegeria marina]
MLKRCKLFTKDEDGAVTVDWVVLTAAVVSLAGIAYSAINGPTGDVSTAVSNTIGGVTVSSGL